MQGNRKSAFSCSGREHSACIETALVAAEEICRERGRRLTHLRRRVLELIWSNHRPVGAYELLEMLQREGRAAPPTVYRALDFLQELGLVHRLSSLNAFMGCSNPNQPHAAQFLICNSCGNLEELRDAGLNESLRQLSRRAEFSLEQQTVELFGLCATCRQRPREARQ